jgi:hypothetical protein
MHVIPGSHSNGFSDYEDVDTPKNTFCRQVLPNAIDESKAVYLELETNESTLYDAGLIHGAALTKLIVFVAVLRIVIFHLIPWTKKKKQKSSTMSLPRTKFGLKYHGNVAKRVR